MTNRSTATVPRTSGLLTPRDRALLGDVWLLRYLTTQQVLRLHFSHPKLAQRRLRLLTRRGFLRRFRAAEAARSGFRMWCYTLAPPSVPIVAQAMGLSHRDVRAVCRPPRSMAFLWHHVLLTDFRIWLREGCRATGGTFGYEFVPAYEETRLNGRRARRVHLPVPEAPRDLVPDGVFALNHRNGKSALFCVEIDRGTEPITGTSPSAIQQKLAVYRTAFHARADAVYGSLFHREFTGFRILFLVPGEQRVTTILNLAERMDLAPLVWLGVHELVRQPGDLAARVWRCHANQPPRSLLE